MCVWAGIHQGVNMVPWGQGEVGRGFGWMVGRGGCWKALEKQKAAVMWPCSGGKVGYMAGARAMGPGCNTVQLCHLPVVLQWRAQQYSWSPCYVPGLACTLVTEGWRCCSCPLEGAMLKKEGERSTRAGIFHTGCYAYCLTFMNLSFLIHKMRLQCLITGLLWGLSMGNMTVSAPSWATFLSTCCDGSYRWEDWQWEWVRWGRAVS